MKSCVFTSGASIELDNFDSLLSFDASYSDWFEVVLSDEKELKILLELLEIKNYKESPLSNSEDFYKIIDFSSSFFPEFDMETFDVFYDKWLYKSGRESDMDEYGQLVFIQGHAKEWNKKNSRFVLLATNN